MGKILMIATVPSMIEKFNMANIQLLQDMGHEVHVGCNFNEYGNSNRAQVENFKSILIRMKIKTHQIDFSRSPLTKNNYLSYRKLKKINEENIFDLIHVHTPVASVITRFAFKKTQAKIIYTAHGFHFFRGSPKINWLVYYPIEKYLTKFTDMIVTINSEDFDVSNRNFKTKTEFINGVGIDTNYFKKTFTNEEKVQFKRDLGLNETDFILTCIGELNKNKNQEFLINSLKYGRGEYHLLLVGTGKLDLTLKSMVNELELENRVTFLGYRSDIKEILEITDVLVAASYREGLPVNIIEAMSMGIPVVSLKNRGSSDLINQSRTGFLIDEEPVSFVKAIDDIYINTDAWTLNSEKINQVVSKYSNRSVSMKMKKIYEEILRLE